MNKVASTAGLFALGVASAHAIYAQELTRLETAKPWTVSASLRGFYDDNPYNAPGGSQAKIGTWGFEARPYVGVNFPMDQTFVGAGFLNSSRYYATPAPGENQWQFDNEFFLKFDHQFSPRYRLKVNDSFLYGITPEVIGAASTTFRSDLSYLRNLGMINFTGELTKTLGFSVTYNNIFYDYLDDPLPNSYSALLNRIEQSVPVDLRFQVQPDLVALIGYQYGIFQYTGDSTFGFPPLTSDSRNFQTHSFYLGADYDITAQLKASVRAGASYVMYDDYSSQDSWTPYVDASLSYFYTVGSHVDVGYKYVNTATDLYRQDAAGVPTLSEEASIVYVLVSHQFTPKLTGNVLLQDQYSNFTGGYYASAHENMFLVSVYANFKFNPYLSAEGGYTYNWLDSNADNRGFDRSMVFLGLRAQY